jgi:hypothetical protein
MLNRLPPNRFVQRVNGNDVHHVDFAQSQRIALLNF